PARVRRRGNIHDLQLVSDRPHQQKRQRFACVANASEPDATMFLGYFRFEIGVRPTTERRQRQEFTQVISTDRFDVNSLTGHRFLCWGWASLAPTDHRIT